MVDLTVGKPNWLAIRRPIIELAKMDILPIESKLLNWNRFKNWPWALGTFWSRHKNCDFPENATTFSIFFQFFSIFSFFFNFFNFLLSSYATGVGSKCIAPAVSAAPWKCHVMCGPLHTFWWRSQICGMSKCRSPHCRHQFAESLINVPYLAIPILI
jgi:hypothetical protein